MEEHKKYIDDTFQQSLIESFAEFCEKHEKEENIEDFITFLMDRNLLTAVTIRRYAIRKEFNRLYPKQNYHKSKTINLLAELFNLSKRYIWYLLKDTNKSIK